MELTDAHKFEVARKLASSFGSYTPAITTAVRTLLADGGATDAEGKNILSKQSYFLVSRLLKCASILSPFYYATLTYHPDEITSRETIEPGDLATHYNPQELASLLSVIYLTRRVGGRCVNEQWSALKDGYQQAVDIAIQLGYTIPAIGPSRGLLTAACRYLAFGIFAIYDPNALKKYRISLRVRKIPYELNDELKDFGTTHLHIGSILLTNLGYSADYVNAYYQSGLDINPEYLDKETTKFTTTMLWLDSLMLTGNPPETELGDDYIISEKRWDTFVQTITSIIEEGSPQEWLFKRKPDIGPHITPKLNFSHIKATPNERNSALPADELSEEISEHLSEEDVESIAGETQA